MAVLRRRFTLSGQVQGVGFRPFVFRTAHMYNITGTVANTPQGVCIEAQGSPSALKAFARDLETALPPLAHVVERTEKSLTPLAHEAAFTILPSRHGNAQQVLISSDTAPCILCLHDMFALDNRRYLYPFTNCTNCGPRYTITQGIPYDRAVTSMACFPLCEQCRAEYENPMDRRFHAQPNACPQCGPHVWLTRTTGHETARSTKALHQTAQILAKGSIVALKGLGGFHLACNATDATAVALLRTRKNRPHKPLAVMVPNLEIAHTLAHIGKQEAQLLQSMERPIVLCQRKNTAPLAPDIAPDTSHVGIMLPYTPLHHVLLHLYQNTVQPDIAALVMTSGNKSGDPICLGNREALQRLAGIADFFLLHNRDILIRTDDSVLHIDAEDSPPRYLRRARGYVPRPVFLHAKAPCVLGTGPELKTTLCLSRNAQAFVSQHLGDMQNMATYAFYCEIAEHLQSVLAVTPKALVCDMHPDYMTTRYALERAQHTGVPLFRLQHHYAHIHSVLAENRHQGPALGLALDGTGYGEDGTIWGGELLYVDADTCTHKRLGHFAPLMLPGGEAAIREPWRIAQGVLWAHGIPQTPHTPWPWEQTFQAATHMLPQILERKLNTPLASSCGRLFDAVSAMLGICLSASYEGQAAIKLEHVQDLCETSFYPCPVQDTQNPLVLDTHSLLLHAYTDWQQGVSAGVISRRFHLGLMRGLTALACHAAQNTGVYTVGLSGGVMQNNTLSRELPCMLRQHGFTVLMHRNLPPNDACVSLGQTLWGHRMLQQA